MCSDSVVFFLEFGCAPTVLYFFRVWMCSDSVVFFLEFGSAPTVLYFFRVWKCSRTYKQCELLQMSNKHCQYILTM
jgi:hypothetical protein